MDAREQLRRYLEQRRETGERELILDGMSVEDVMRIIGARAGASATASPATRSVERTETRSDNRGGERAEGDAQTNAPRHDERPQDDTPVGDWREVLRAAGS